MKYRHEHKHRINTADFLILSGKLKHFAQPDVHCRNGAYFIRSLYFDNYFDKALREKVDGISVREKFRIRFYNMDDSFILLEKKGKHMWLTAKENTPLKRKQVEQIIADLLRLDGRRTASFSKYAAGRYI